MIERLLEKQIAAETTIIQALVGGEKPGRELRELVNKDLVAQRFSKFSGPGFYQFMADMQERKLVTYEIRSKKVEGQEVKERWYSYTGGGTRLKPPEAKSDDFVNLGGSFFPGPQTANVKN